MPTYSCHNCCNLKTRIISKEHIAAIRKYKIQKALETRDTDSLGLDFPFNLTVYKRISRDAKCRIIYCAEHMFNRDLYIGRENFNMDMLLINKHKPCPKYR